MWIRPKQWSAPCIAQWALLLSSCPRFFTSCSCASGQPQTRLSSRSRGQSCIIWCKREAEMCWVLVQTPSWWCSHAAIVLRGWSHKATHKTKEFTYLWGGAGPEGQKPAKCEPALHRRSSCSSASTCWASWLCGAGILRSFHFILSQDRNLDF